MKAKSLIFYVVLSLAVFLVFPQDIFSITVQDFRVNTDTAVGIAQYHADIAFDSLGNFVIVFCDRGINHDFRQIYFHRFDSQANRLGDPVLVSDTTLHYNDAPTIAMHSSGNFVIAWQSFSGDPERINDIWIRRYDSSGNPLALWQKVDVDRPDPESLSMEDRPFVAMDKEGNFIVVWTTQAPSEGRNVFAQRFSPSGERTGNNFLVSDVNASDYPLCGWFTQDSRAAYNPQGYFFVCWTGCIKCKPWSPTATLARIYNPLGVPITKVFPPVDPCFSRWQYSQHSSVASNNQNNFMIGSNVNDTLNTYPNNAIMVQSFDTLGNPLDTGMIANDVMDLGDITFMPRIAVDSSDGYVVLWSDQRTITDRNLWAQGFSSSGEKIGQNYRINMPPGVLKYGGSMYDLAICGNTFGAAWVDSRNLTLYYTDIYAKLLDLDKIGYYLRGDVTLDGNIDIGDVIYLINYLFRNGWGIVPEWIGDVNCDGIVNVGDIIYLINYLFKGGPPPESN